MQVIYEHCCGIDVHKKVIVCCMRRGRKSEIREFGTYTRDLREITQWLLEADCQMVAMESTGPYWKPLYNVFEMLEMHAIIVNAAHIKAVPGRKTDTETLIDKYMDVAYKEAADSIDALPGIAKTSAQQIVAEIGIDMSRFPSSGHLCSWAGICPGNNESAGKRKSGKTKKGNKMLKSTLTQCAMVAVKDKDSYFHAQYQRLLVRRGKKKAIVAIAHSMLIAIYHVLSGSSFVNLGADYYNQFGTEKKINAYLAKIKKLGWEPPLAASVS